MKQGDLVCIRYTTTVPGKYQWFDGSVLSIEKEDNKKYVVDVAFPKQHNEESDSIAKVELLKNEKNKRWRFVNPEPTRTILMVSIRVVDENGKEYVIYDD